MAKGRKRGAETKEGVKDPEKRSKEQLEHDLESQRIDNRSDIIHHAITVGGVVAAFYFLNEMVQSIAGKATFAEIGVEIFGKEGVSTLLAWFLTAVGVGYGELQRRLRVRVTRRLGDRIETLELEIDPDRSSSRLEE